MLEDRDGFIWVGTSTGLARLEGTRVRTYFHDSKDPTTINNDQINDLVQAGDGSIWVATANGICTYLPERDAFERHYVQAAPEELHQANRVWDLVPQGGRWLWFASGDGTLHRLDRRNGSMERIGKGMTPGSGLPSDTVLLRSLAWDEQHQGLWVGTQAGPCFIGPDGRSLDVRDHPAAWNCFTQGPCSAPTPDGTGGLWWFAVDGYHLHHSALNGTPIVTEDSLGSARNHFTVRRMKVDRSRRLWIGTWTHELHAVAPDGSTERIRADRRPWSVRSERCEAFLERRNGELWLGTNEGIDVHRPSFQRMEVHAFDLPVACLRLLGPDTLLVGTAGSGLHLLARDGTTARSIVPDPFSRTEERSWRNHVEAFSPHGGDIWVPTTWGARVFTRHGRSFTDVEALGRMAPELGSKHITFIADDPYGSTWIGTWQDGLFRWRGDSVEHWSAAGQGPGRPPIDKALCFLVDRRGDAWIGFNDGGGLARMRRCEPPLEDMLNARRGDPDRSDGVVRCLAEAPDGRIWFGTHEGGAGIIDPASGRCTMLTRSDGLPGDRVSGIHFDRLGVPWVATTQGIAYRPLGAAHFIAFPLPFGLDPGSITGALGEGFDGSVAIGVGRSLVMIDPGVASTGPALPASLVTSILVGDSLMHRPASPIELSFTSRALALMLGAIHFGSGQVQFAYRDAAIDTVWRRIGNASRIDLNALAVGDHRIEVRASLDGINWGATTQALRVTVRPPFWATWWFRLLAASLIALIAWAGIRYYVRERLAEQRAASAREQAVLNERMRIADDMHDDLGAGLSGLKLRSEMALRVEQDPAKRELLSAMASGAGELIGSMRQIIWTMNSDQAGIEDLVVYAGNYARTYAEANGLAIEVEQGGPWPVAVLSSELRRNVFLVMKEALHNTVKHARARRIRLRMAWADGLLVEIQDDGTGLPPGSDQAIGNGLRTMEKRIAALGGSIAITARQGTLVRFSVPVRLPNQGSIAPSSRA